MTRQLDVLAAGGGGGGLRAKFKISVVPILSRKEVSHVRFFSLTIRTVATRHLRRHVGEALIESLSRIVARKVEVAAQNIVDMVAP